MENFVQFLVSSEDEIQDESDEEWRRHRRDGKSRRRVAEVGAAVADPPLDAPKSGNCWEDRGS